MCACSGERADLPPFRPRSLPIPCVHIHRICFNTHSRTPSHLAPPEGRCSIHRSSSIPGSIPLASFVHLWCCKKSVLPKLWFPLLGRPDNSRYTTTAADSCRCRRRMSPGTPSSSRQPNASSQPAPRPPSLPPLHPPSLSLSLSLQWPVWPPACLLLWMCALIAALWCCTRRRLACRAFRHRELGGFVKDVKRPIEPTSP